jgi:hypothetical protein
MSTSTSLRGFFDTALEHDQQRIRIRQAIQQTQPIQSISTDPLYNPFRPIHPPLIRFEYLLNRWLDHPSSSASMKRLIWTAAAESYQAHFPTSLFVPYVLSVLFRSATVQRSTDLAILNRMEEFTEILEFQRLDQNPHYSKLLYYPIRRDLLKPLQDRTPLSKLWQILDPSIVEFNGAY